MTRKKLAAQNDRIKELLMERGVLRLSVKMSLRHLAKNKITDAVVLLERALERTGNKREEMENLADGIESLR